MSFTSPGVSRLTTNYPLIELFIYFYIFKVHLCHHPIKLTTGDSLFLVLIIMAEINGMIISLPFMIQ